MKPARFEQLAGQAFFQRRFVCGNVVFAELPVSLGQTHGVAVNTVRKALFCTCFLQPKPCLHARALALLLEREGDAAFEPVAALPPWVEALQNGQSAQLPSSHVHAPAQTRRYLDRLERAANGFVDLENWLLDTLRRGIATALSEDPEFYKNIAGRLADASMRGLSRNFRTLDAVPTGQSDWSERVADTLAGAALALHAFRQREQLPEALLHDLEAFIGIAPKKDQVRAQGETISDTWAVAGAVEELVEAELHTRRTWLLGVRSARFALLLEYAYGEAAFLPGLVPGTVVEGSLTFYPSAWPLRALAPDDLRPLAEKVEKLPGFENICGLADAYAGALGKQPWLASFPVVLNNATPYRHCDRFGLADQTGRHLPLANAEPTGWALLACSGGGPLTIFGEWDGNALRVLSAVAAQRFIAFG